MLVAGGAVEAHVFVDDVAVPGEGHVEVEDVVAEPFIQPAAGGSPALY